MQRPSDSMPHAQAHDPSAVIQKPGMTAANVSQQQNYRILMPLVTQMHLRAQWASMCKRRHMQLSVRLNWVGADT